MNTLTQTPEQQENDLLMKCVDRLRKTEAGKNMTTDELIAAVLSSGSSK